ncbi:hypothetical protein JCM15415_17630 [Methanobacterium movens]
MDMIYLQALGWWVVLIIMALLTATLNNRIIFPKVKNELRAHQITSLISIVLFLILIYVFFRFTTAPYTPGDVVNIGFIWMILTLGVEFLFAVFVAKQPLSRSLQNYNITRGRLWIWVLVSLLMGPVLITSYLL